MGFPNQTFFSHRDNLNANPAYNTDNMSKLFVTRFARICTYNKSVLVDAPGHANVYTNKTPGV